MYTLREVKKILADFGDIKYRIENDIRFNENKPYAELPNTYIEDFMNLKETLRDCSAIQDTLSYRRAEKPKMEKLLAQMMEYKDVQEITITFRQKWRDQYEDDAISKCVNAFIMANLEYFEIHSIVIVPEYGNNNNLHYHGLVTGLHNGELRSRFKGSMTRRFGRTSVSAIKYPSSYIKYILKEQGDYIRNMLYIEVDKFKLL